MMWLNEPPVTASAYSQARYKLKHTAFIGLNRSAIVDTVYSDDEYHKFWGFRILAVDGSKVVLPNTEKVREEFGTINYTEIEILEKAYRVIFNESDHSQRAPQSASQKNICEALAKFP